MLEQQRVQPVGHAQREQVVGRRQGYQPGARTPSLVSLSDVRNGLDITVADRSTNRALAGLI